jgi:hypothetical protein
VLGAQRHNRGRGGVVRRGQGVGPGGAEGRARNVKEQVQFIEAGALGGPEESSWARISRARSGSVTNTESLILAPHFSHRRTSMPRVRCRSSAQGRYRSRGCGASRNDGSISGSAALGFPQSSLAAHTEARSVRKIPLQKGDVMLIKGKYKPCTTCKGKMNKAATKSGAKIIYKWPGGKWQAGE